MDTSTKLALLDYQKGSEQVPVGHWSLKNIYTELVREELRLLIFVHQETQESCVVLRVGSDNLNANHSKIIGTASSILSQLNQSTPITLLSRGDPSTYWLYYFHLHFQSCGYGVVSASWEAPTAFRSFVRNLMMWERADSWRLIGYYAANFWHHKIREHKILKQIRVDRDFIQWSKGVVNYKCITTKLERNHQLHLRCTEIPSMSEEEIDSLGVIDEGAARLAVSKEIAVIEKSAVNSSVYMGCFFNRNRVSDPNIPQAYLVLPRDTFLNDQKVEDILMIQRKYLLSAIRYMKEEYAKANEWTKFLSQFDYQRNIRTLYHTYLNTSIPRMGCVILFYWPSNTCSDGSKSYSHISVGLRFYENYQQDKVCQLEGVASPKFDLYGSYYDDNETKKWRFVDEYEKDLKAMHHEEPKTFKVLVPNVMPVYRAMKFMEAMSDGKYRVWEPRHILDFLFDSTFVQGLLPIVYTCIPCIPMSDRIASGVPKDFYRIIRTGNANCVDFVSIVLHGTLDTQPDRVMPSIQFLANTMGLVMFMELYTSQGLPFYFQLGHTQYNISEHVEILYQTLASKYPGCFRASHTSFTGVFSNNTYTSSMFDDEKMIFNIMFCYFSLVTLTGILIDLSHCWPCLRRLCVRTPWGMYTMLKHHAKERMMPIRHCLFGCHTSVFYPIAFGIMGSYCGDLALSTLPMNMPECAGVTANMSHNHSWSQAIPPFSTFGDSWPNKESYTKRMCFKVSILVTLGLGMLESWVAFFYDYCHRQRSRQVREIMVKDPGPRARAATELTALLQQDGTMDYQAVSESKQRDGVATDEVKNSY